MPELYRGKSAQLLEELEADARVRATGEHPVVALPDDDPSSRVRDEAREGRRNGRFVERGPVISGTKEDSLPH